MSKEDVNSWVSLRNSNPHSRYDQCEWNGTTMPSGLEINVSLVNMMVRKYQIVGRVHLSKMLDKRGGVGEISGAGEATIAGAVSRKKRRVKRTDKRQDLFINFEAIEDEAHGYKRESDATPQQEREYIAYAVDQELKKGLMQIMLLELCAIWGLEIIAKVGITVIIALFCYLATEGNKDVVLPLLIPILVGVSFLWELDSLVNTHATHKVKRQFGKRMDRQAVEQNDSENIQIDDVDFFLKVLLPKVFHLPQIRKSIIALSHAAYYSLRPPLLIRARKGD